MPPTRTIPLGEANLTLADVQALAENRATLTLTPTAITKIQAARRIVESLVETQTPAYGITTGVGSQKDYEVSPAQIARYNALMITAHATRAPGPNATPEATRAACAIQLHLFAKGRSGVSLELVESLLARFHADDLPDIRQNASVGASDIVALSQMAAPLLARPGPPPPGQGPRPLATLHAKEAVSLLNANSLMLAQAALALAETRHLLNAAMKTAALSMEGFRGNLQSWSAPIDAARGQTGQTKAGLALRAALQGSRLWNPTEARLLQDPLSFRCVPQVHGAAEAAYAFAHDILETELNAAADNPLIQMPEGRFISHGNMETTACAMAIDMLRQSVAKIIEAAGQRIHKIQWPSFTDLPTSLAEHPGAIGGVQFLNLGHLAGANVAAVRQAAAPAMLNYSGQLDDGVEDVAGNAPQSIAETERSFLPAWNTLAVEAACAVWAIHRRNIPHTHLGAALQPLAARIRPLLPIGTEGQAIFDLALIVAILQADARIA